MGGAEDDEPPSKRVKVSSSESKSISNGLSLVDPTGFSLSVSMARPLSSQGDEEIFGSSRIRKVELVRIIAEALYSLGYNKTALNLEEESGVYLHSSSVKLLMQQIVDGNWDESVATLRKIGAIDETVIKSASFMIFEQKFLELLASEKVCDALKCLRNDIAPLRVHDSRVRELSSYVLIGSSGQNGEKLKCREKILEELSKLLPPAVIIPEKRLLHLVEQALDLQKETCLYHNSLVKDMSLLTDHQCGRDYIPSQTLQVLQEHTDEVWFLQFSHNGKYLASASKDRSAIIWKVNADGKVTLMHKLTGHQKPVSCLSWSPNDNQLLTCGVEESVRQWDISSGECLHIYEKIGLGLISCGWGPDGKQVFAGVTDKSISMWDLEGNEMDSWKGQQTVKISDLGVTADGKKIVTMCRNNVIQLFDKEARRVEKVIEEDQVITSFSLSRDNKLLLVSLLNQEIHLWNVEGQSRRIAKYKGHKRTRFVVRACFGGYDQAFVAGGSEDSQVYIWHKSSGNLIETLPGHSGAVNCVSWNSTNPYMLASASDDRTIRIWGLNTVNIKQKGTQINGFRCCNGGGTLKINDEDKDMESGK